MSKKPTYKELEEEIRELKKSLSESKSNEARFKEAQKAAHIGSWDYNIKSGKLYWSEELYKIYGLEPGLRLELNHAIDSIHPEDKAFAVDAFKKAKNEGSPYELVYRICRPDGTVRSIQGIGKAKKGKNGDVVGVFGTGQDITELKQAEETLRVSEARYRTVLETINDGVVLQAASGKILTWNKGAEDIFGISAEEAIGQTSEGKDWPTIHEDGSKYEGRAHPSMRTLSTGKPCSNEIMGVYQPSGELRWISINTSPLFTQDLTKPDAVAISFTDITERKKTEDELRYINYLLSLWMDNSPAVAFMKDIHGNITFVNRSFEKLFSLLPGEIIGKTDHDLYSTSPETAKQMRANDRLVMDAAKPLTLDETVMVDGKPRHFETVKFPLQNTEKEITGIAGLAVDVTDRKNAMDALLESEKKHRSIMENTGVGILVIQDGRNVYTNPKVYEMLELSKEEFDSREFLTFLHPEDRELAIKRIQERLTHDAPGRVPTQMRVLTKSGDIRWIETNSVMMQWEGKPAVQAYINDITERKRLEEELRQAHKMEAIGNLAGGIAHEFNNVLGIILGNAELAIDDVPDWNPAKESLKEIRKASLGAKDVVRQILSFARKSMTALKPLEIDTIVKESLKLMRASIPTMIDIQANIPSKPNVILGDPTEIHQIIINLCTNAAQAMRKRGGILEIGISEVTLDEKTSSRYEGLSPGEYVGLTVNDSGEGMEKKILERAFEPYFTTKEFGAGSGMGLAVVYGIVKKCMGAINIDSNVGKGTTVEVLFPKIEEEALAEEEEEPGLHTGNERILLVDDDPSIADMIRQMLERMGYTVSSLTDSTSALERFRSSPDDFDLVITDMSMPKMSGDQLAAELMKIRKDVPILLCTGHSDTIDEKRAKKIGIRGFAMKPLDKGKLAGAVRAVLDKDGDD